MIDQDYFIAKAAADRMVQDIAGLDKDHREVALGLATDALAHHNKNKRSISDDEIYRFLLQPRAQQQNLSEWPFG